ncbi:MAG: type III polyketide synthase [Gemmataceae bacterium]
MSLALPRFGLAVPSTRIDQDQALTIARSLARPSDEQDTWLPGMYQGTRIASRHLALPDTLIRDILHGTRHSGSVYLPTSDPTDRGPTTGQRLEHYRKLAPPLACEASHRALQAAECLPEAITHLVTVSCTGFLAPGLDRDLIVTLGLPSTVERTHIGYMGCHGALNGLRVARALAEADSSARVLLCATELCSLHYHYSWNPQKMVANALFADGAAAVVASASTASGKACWHLRANGACLIPDSADAMTWTIGDHGFEMTLARNVPSLIGQHLRPFLHNWLQRHGLTIEQVAAWAIHPGGPKILTAVQQTLKLSEAQMQASYAVLGRYGNMSSPTLLFILDELACSEAVGPCVALGFGPGLAVEVALFDRGG